MCNEFGSLRDGEHLPQRFITCIGIGEAQVIRHRTREQEGLLWSVGNARAQDRKRDIHDRNAIEIDRACACVVHTHDEVDQARFARTRRSDKSGYRIGRDLEGKIAQGILLRFGITKAHMIHLEDRDTALLSGLHRGFFGDISSKCSQRTIFCGFWQ